MEKYNDYAIADNQLENLQNAYQKQSKPHQKKVYDRLVNILHFFEKTNKHYAIFLCKQNIKIIESNFETKILFNGNKNCNTTFAKSYFATKKFSINNKNTKHISQQNICDYVAKTITIICNNMFDYSFFQSTQLLMVIKNLAKILYV